MPSMPSMPSSPVSMSTNGLDVNWKGRYVHVGFDGIKVHPESGPKVEIYTNGTMDIFGESGVNVHIGIDGVSVIDSTGNLLFGRKRKPKPKPSEEQEGQKPEQQETKGQEEVNSEEETTTASSGVMGYLGWMNCKQLINPKATFILDSWGLPLKPTKKVFLDFIIDSPARSVIRYNSFNLMKSKIKRWAEHFCFFQRV